MVQGIGKIKRRRYRFLTGCCRCRRIAQGAPTALPKGGVRMPTLSVVMGTLAKAMGTLWAPKFFYFSNGYESRVPRVPIFVDVARYIRASIPI